MKIAALEQKTYRELRRIAARAGLTGRSRMRKSQLVRAILKGRKNRPAIAVSPLKRRKAARSGSPKSHASRVSSRRRSVVRKQANSSFAPTSAREGPASSERSADLPAEYGRTRLTLMEVDPRRVHAYWEVTAKDRNAAVRSLGGETPSAKWVLRFYESASAQSAPRRSAHHFDVDVDLAPGSWYITLPSPGKSYRADLGPIDAGGRFVAACTSNTVHAPRPEQSSHYAPRWMQVTGQRTRRVPEPVPELAGTSSGSAASAWDTAFEEVLKPEPAESEEELRGAVTAGLVDISSFELGSRSGQIENADTTGETRSRRSR